jgi:hypothetical protein
VCSHSRLTSTHCYTHSPVHCTCFRRTLTVTRPSQIAADYTYFELGTYYYLANDPKVLCAVSDSGPGCAGRGEG